MAEPDSVRRRVAVPIETNGGSTIDGDDKAKKPKKASDANGFSILDIVKILLAFITVSSALSWFVIGDSVLWGYSPWWSRPDVVLSYFVRIYLKTSMAIHER
jgi:hypothetical protein